MVTLFGLGADGGATYVTESDVSPPPADCAVTTVSTPHVFPLHPLPDSDHTSTSLGFDPAAGVNVATIPAAAPAATLTGAESCNVKLLTMVSVAEARFDESATLCAVSVAVAGVGRIRGAVKLPLTSTTPHPIEHAAPDMAQLTAWSGCPPLESNA